MRQRLLAGGVAGAVSRTMVAPLERLRTIMMASPVALSMQEAVQTMWRDGGPSGVCVCCKWDIPRRYICYETRCLAACLPCNWCSRGRLGLLLLQTLSPVLLFTHAKSTSPLASINARVQGCSRATWRQ